ncbi:MULTISPECIES: PBECR4 domain-containing protein [Helcococcus]|uniref:PBECR4 domain-containing protein n=1 Tax=Helcococcus bovis TaxID=3153252 RepID=A0ABW9F617_9FIRM
MYKIHSIIKWWENFDNSNITIKTESNEFNIKIFNDMLPHLLGMQYTQKNTKYLKGARLYSFIKNRSDEELLGLISKNHPNKMNNIIDRIENFQYFMENIENSILYNQTHSKSTIKSNFLLVKTKENTYLQMGIAQSELYIDYFETFIVEKNDQYFKKSTLNEKVISIERWDNDKFVPFSFKDFVQNEQNRKEKIMNNTFDKEKWKKEKENKVKELEIKINNLIKDFKHNKEDIVEFIKFSLKFRNYSYKNTMLIYSQNKSANYIASFNKISKMGYSIKKGEKAIKIFAPTESKYAVVDLTHKPFKKLTKEEKEQVKNKELKVISYRNFVPVNVFDISQSDIKAEDLPKLLGFNNLIDIEVKDKIEIIEKYAKNNNTQIYYNNLPLNLKGEYYPGLNQIIINERLDDIGKLSTLTHELGHSLLHNDAVDYQSDNENVIEVQADITTLLLFEYFNIPVVDSRIEHLKYHFEKLDEKQIEKLILPVINVTNEVINNIEKFVPERQKEEIEIEQNKEIENNIESKEKKQNKDKNNIDYER